MEVKILDEHLGVLLGTGEIMGKQKYPHEVIIAFKKRVSQIKAMKDTRDLRAIKSLHFEKLVEKRYSGKYSIRLNKAYRLIFGIDHNGMLEVIVIEEINNHYG